MIDIQERKLYKCINEYTSPKHIYVLCKKPVTKENLGRNDIDNPLYLVLELWQEGEVNWLLQSITSNDHNELAVYGLEDFTRRYELVEDE